MPRLDFRRLVDPLPDARRLVREFQVGGFLVFGGEVNQIRAATEELQAIAKIPLFFACDAERGLGQIVRGGARFPFAMSLGAAGDEDLAYRQAAFIADEMRGAGLNLLFAPVVDVNSNPDNPIINIRSFGDSPELVARLGVAFIRGCEDGGVLACAKHFPGHGGVAIDSHVELPVSAGTLRDFAECDLIPFKRAIESGVASIMVAHLALPEIDPSMLPATLSSEIIGKLLVRDMRGLVITDSFIMDALGGLGEESDLARRSILAGCDIVLDPKDPTRLIERLISMAGAGEIPDADLDRAARKILAVKKKRLKSETSPKSPSPESPSESGEELIREIARRSVCSLNGRTLRSRSAGVYLLDAARSIRDGENVSSAFIGRLRDAGVSCEFNFISPEAAASFPIREDVARAAIVLIRTMPAAWTGSSDLPESYRDFLKRISMLDSEKVFVSLGSPYVIRRIKPEDFDVILFAFDSIPECERAAADALLGVFTPTGRMPVRLF